MGTRAKERAPARKPKRPRCACGELAVTWRPGGARLEPLCEKHRDEYDAATRRSSSSPATSSSSSSSSRTSSSSKKGLVITHVRRDPTTREQMRRVRAELGDEAPPRRAALYIRVSTEDQELANQRPELAQLAAARKLRVVETFEEAASAAGARPRFDAMMAAAHAGAFDVLLVWAIDRFGRSMLGNVRDVLELERRGVDVISVREPWLDTSGPVRDLLLAIFSWVAEQERRRLGERTRAGMDRARATGKHIGRPSARVDVNALDLWLSKRVGRGKRARPTFKTIARALNISEATLHRELARRRSSKNAAASF